MMTHRRPAARRSRNFRNASAHLCRRLRADPLERDTLSSYHSCKSSVGSASCPLYPQKRTLVERVWMSALYQKQTTGATLLFDRLVSAWAAKRNCHQGPKLTAVASPCAQRAQTRSFAYLPLTALRQIGSLRI